MVVLTPAGAGFGSCERWFQFIHSFFSRHGGHKGRSPGRRKAAATALLLVALIFRVGPGEQQLVAQSPVPDYRVKATFLFQFTQFVDWPSETFSSPEGPLVIGILGEDPFGSFLDDTVRDEKSNGHPLVVQRYQRLEDIKSCHVLFVSKQEVGRIADIAALAKQRSILTVSDTVDFADRGGMIQFVTLDKKVHLRINLGAAKSANLMISAKLLRLARVINAGSEWER